MGEKDPKRLLELVRELNRELESLDKNKKRGNYDGEKKLQQTA
jgi:hypothetical protein